MSKSLSPAAASDIDLLNAAIGLEQVAQYAYKAAGGTGLLSADVLAVATKIASQHADHEKALAAEVTKLGGTPTKAQDKYDLPALTSQTAILQFALGKEKEAANAYFMVLQGLSSATLKQLSGSIMNDETSHVVVLASALGMSPLDSTAFMPLAAS
jgi:rubrerythrin